MARVLIDRIVSGPRLVLEDAEALALDFLRIDPSAQRGGYDDLAGRAAHNRITRDDIVAINTTMRARSPHIAWDALISDTNPLAWLSDIDPAWDLVMLDEATWSERARPAVEAALASATGPGRGISVGTKVLHLKRPLMFPVLDALVLQQLGATESVSALRVVDHLRAVGRRNIKDLRLVQAAVKVQYPRSLVRLLDILLWASHPAAGLSPSLRGWEHVIRRQETDR